MSFNPLSAVKPRDMIENSIFNGVFRVSIRSRRLSREIFDDAVALFGEDKVSIRSRRLSREI